MKTLTLILVLLSVGITAPAFSQSYDERYNEMNRQTLNNGKTHIRILTEELEEYSTKYFEAVDNAIVVSNGAFNQCESDRKPNGTKKKQASAYRKGVHALVVTIENAVAQTKALSRKAAALSEGQSDACGSDGTQLSPAEYVVCTTDGVNAIMGTHIAEKGKEFSDKISEFADDAKKFAACMDNNKSAFQTQAESFADTSDLLNGISDEYYTKLNKLIDMHMELENQ